MSHKTVILKIFRGAEGFQYWESFEIPIRPMLNVITALMQVQERPITTEGKRVAPVAWEQACLEEVCGSCSMLINGRPRQACSCILTELIEKSGSNVVTLAPLTKFPLLRDLVVDRSRLFKNLKKIKAWVPVSSLNPKDEGEKITPDRQQLEYELSTCMSCTCCLEACPQFHEQSDFIGAATIGQAHLFDIKKGGLARERLRVLMDKGGVSDCGKAMNCVAVCPKNIQLVRSIATMGAKVSRQALKELFGDPSNED